MALPYQRWMASCQAVDHLTPAQFCFPGTHDSGCYGSIDFTPVVSKEAMAKSDERFAPGFQTMATRWAITQPGSPFYLQLCHGVRFLDVRVGLCAQDNTYYLVHTFAVAKLDDALADVKRFVEENPTEVIVLDVKPYFNIVDTKLAAIIESYLGTYMYPDKNQDGSFPETIAAMVHKKQTVICIYHLENPAQETRPSPRWYKASQCLFYYQFETIDTVAAKEKRLTAVLDNFLAQRQSDKVPKLFQLSFTLTETDSDVASSVFTGDNLGTLAKKMDADIQRYLFTVLSPQQRQAIAVITVDYENSSTLLPNALHLNKEKLAAHLAAEQASATAMLRRTPATPPSRSTAIESHRLPSKQTSTSQSEHQRRTRRSRLSACCQRLRRLCCCCCCDGETDNVEKTQLLDSQCDTW